MVKDTTRSDLLAKISQQVKDELGETLMSKMDEEDLEILSADEQFQKTSNVVETDSGEDWDIEAYTKQALEGIPAFKRKVEGAVELLVHGKL